MLKEKSKAFSKINESERAGYEAYYRGIPKTRNPFQYSSNIMKQAWWLTGWQKAEKNDIASCKTGLKV